MNTSILLLAAMACGQTFTVTNRVAEFSVVNKCAPDCQCGVSCPCADLAMVREITNKMHTDPPVNKPATITVIEHNYPRTHTHTCPNPNCSFLKTYKEPFVWDHPMNASHQCPYCGTSQYVAGTRSTTVLKTISVAAAPPVAYQPPPVMQTLYSSVSSGGCANGQCSTTLQGRRGFFR